MSCADYMPGAASIEVLAELADEQARCQLCTSIPQLACEVDVYACNNQIVNILVSGFGAHLKLPANCKLTQPARSADPARAPRLLRCRTMT